MPSAPCAVFSRHAAILATLCGLASAATALAQGAQERINLSPDCLQVENLHSERGLVKSIGITDTRLAIFVWVPQSTSAFTLEILDQQDDTPAAKPSQFCLLAPDGSVREELNRPLAGGWASYPVEVRGNWGLWCLKVRGPQDMVPPAGSAPQSSSGRAVNRFMVRSRGQVDLFLQPEAGSRVRGLRLGSPGFTPLNSRSLFLRAPGSHSLRLSLLHTPAPNGATGSGSLPVELNWPGARKEVFALQGDDRLSRGRHFSLLGWHHTVPLAADTLLPLSLPVSPPATPTHLGLGVEQSVQLFFHPRPLLAPPRPVHIETRDTAGRALAATVTVRGDRTGNLPTILHTDTSGAGTFWAWPGVEYTFQAHRSWEYGQASGTPGRQNRLRLVLPRKLHPPAGWWAGDAHSHTWLYDGTDSPQQMVRAARAAGLSWLAISEHAHSAYLERSLSATREARLAAEAGDTPHGPAFTVLTAAEYTGPTFHANIFGLPLAFAPGSTLGQLVQRVGQARAEGQAAAVQLNHPALGQTAANLALQTSSLEMLELWNSREPQTTQLWFQLLNAGRRIVATTGSDSHYLHNLPPGTRRLYTYTGTLPPNETNIIQAMARGNSVLSRGGFVDFSVAGKGPGEEHHLLPSQNSLSASLHVMAGMPLHSVEIVHNGEVAARQALHGATEWKGNLSFPAQPGWCLARLLGPEAARDARNEEATLALTNPLWLGRASAAPTASTTPHPTP